MNKVHSMRSSWSLNTAGNVAFLPDDSHFLKDTNNCERAHTMAGKWDSHAFLNWGASTGGKKKSPRFVLNPCDSTSLLQEFQFIFQESFMRHYFILHQWWNCIYWTSCKTTETSCYQCFFVASHYSRGQELQMEDTKIQLSQY